MADNRQIKDRLMNEVAIYGGLPMRRVDIYTLAKEHLGEGKPGGFNTPDYFAFKPEAVDAEPHTLDEARSIMEAP